MNRSDGLYMAGGSGAVGALNSKFNKHAPSKKVIEFGAWGVGALGTSIALYYERYINAIDARLEEIKRSRDGSC